ncbi:MAG TPA: hypothetical protein VKZ78_06160 [Sphingobacteriaceae bacterium]|nr:hypothetical protein [Sphingobacteriaceae bacterium]
MELGKILQLLQKHRESSILDEKASALSWCSLGKISSSKIENEENKFNNIDLQHDSL